MKFKDVTSIYPSIVAICSNNGNDPEVVRVYENETSRIIYSFNDQGKRASISSSGNKVKDSEIDYLISEIMKVDHTKITGHISSNGVYHLKHKTLNQHEQYPVSDILQ